MLKDVEHVPCCKLYVLVKLNFFQKNSADVIWKDTVLLQAKFFNVALGATKNYKQAFALKISSLSLETKKHFLKQINDKKFLEPHTLILMCNLRCKFRPLPQQQKVNESVEVTLVGTFVITLTLFLQFFKFNVNI